MLPPDKIRNLFESHITKRLNSCLPLHTYSCESIHDEIKLNIKILEGRMGPEILSPKCLPKEEVSSADTNPNSLVQ